MMHRAPQSVLEVQRVSETYMRAAEALAALESGACGGGPCVPSMRPG